jgi:hypothetical protein
MCSLEHRLLSSLPPCLAMCAISPPSLRRMYSGSHRAAYGGRVMVLNTTNVISRGIDVLQVTQRPSTSHPPRRTNISLIILKLGFRSKWPSQLIVRGPPRPLYGLIASLRKIRAPNDSQRSKVEFSKRMPVFNMRFLVGRRIPQTVCLGC